MSIIEIHDRLADTCNYFLAALTLWSLVLWLRNQTLSGNWLGAAAIYEALVVIEGLLGGYLYVQGYGAALDRSWLHALYGINAVIIIPAAYLFFNSIENERAKSLAMALACAFAWLMLQRNFYTGEPIPTVLRLLGIG